MTFIFIPLLKSEIFWSHEIRPTTFEENIVISTKINGEEPHFLLIFKPPQR